MPSQVGSSPRACCRQTSGMGRAGVLVPDSTLECEAAELGLLPVTRPWGCAEERRWEGL